MGSSSEDETALPAPAAKKNQKLAFSNPFKFSHKSRSYTTKSTYNDPTTPSPGRNEKLSLRDPKNKKLTRSQSEDVSSTVREEWGNRLWSQDELHESLDLLRSSANEYELEATKQQWTDLLRIHANVTELGKLADTFKKNDSTKELDGETADGLSKFSAVALEYSKMLDVVMNQSPEYAGLAWGVSHDNTFPIQRITI